MADRLSNIYLRIFVSHLRRQDTDQKLLFEELGIAHLYGQDIRPEGDVDLEMFVDLLHKSEARFSNKLFAAEAGRNVHISDYGLLGLIVSSCRTYGQANEIGYRYQHLVSRTIRRSPLRIGQQLYSRMEKNDYDPEYLRPYIELEFSAMVHMSHYITGNLYSKVPITVSFMHKAAASLPRYLDIFTTPVMFSQPYNEFRMHEAVLQAPIYGQDNQVMNMVLGRVKEIEIEAGHDKDTVNRLTKHIRATIAHQVPDLNNCAKALDMSISTLKRKLKESGSSFQVVLDHVRYSIARNMLSNADVSQEDIRCVLGFSDTNAFRKAFQRWSGMTPTEFQKKNI